MFIAWHPSVIEPAQLIVILEDLS